jgi:hypothetical protein
LNKILKRRKKNLIKKVNNKLERILYRRKIKNYMQFGIEMKMNGEISVKFKKIKKN